MILLGGILPFAGGTIRASESVGSSDGGPFQPTWDSLATYQTPDWFRDAKFGLWAHWGVQCEPEHGDWYAHEMYKEGSADYQFQVEHYGHPSVAGFKDVIPHWKAERFDPDKLLQFYKENGARYFVALATHCDNFDNWNSTFQPWNSVRMGPHRDLIRDWATAARKAGLRFGVSLHNGGWTWQWYEVAQGADATGPKAGVPYDGRMTKADGKGKWWDGLDPQDLYAQNHAVGAKPDAAYCEKFVRRATQLLDDYKPDLVYFDESEYPMAYLGVDSSYGLGLYAHFYNASVHRDGRNEAVITAKKLSPLERKAVTYDIERGKATDILPEPWQTDTCLGNWHYDRALFEHHGYKTAAQILPLLVDVVSKNGNLLLSVPLQADGQPDSDEIAIVRDIGRWLAVNGEAIYGTRPWRIYGEGPSTTRGQAAPFDANGSTDIPSAPFGAEDVRFTVAKDGSALYALIFCGPADQRVVIRSLPSASGRISRIDMLGHSGTLTWKQGADGLVVTLPDHKPCDYLYALRIRGDDLKPTTPSR